ncbi:MAG: amidohydrolase, partial [Turicibacter sp.]|nr:amidohydrolase [Turicibacter sp.]
PAYTKSSFYIRAAKTKTCKVYKEKIIKIGEGAALATGCTFKYDDSLNSVKEMFIVPSFEALYIEEAKQLGIDIQTQNCKSIGSTDAGNVSQVVPTIHPTIKICDDSITLHTEEFKEAAKSEIGDEALINGAMLLARIAIRLLTDESYLNQVKSEFQAIKSMNEESVG